MVTIMIRSLFDSALNKSEKAQNRARLYETALNALYCNYLHNYNLIINKRLGSRECKLLWDILHSALIWNHAIINQLRGEAVR